jgi:hypothetical protein
MCAVVTVIFGVCNSVTLAQLFLVTFCKCSIHLITNPSPVYSYFKIVTPDVKSKIGLSKLLDRRL